MKGCLTYRLVLNMHFPNLGGWKSIFGTQVSFVTLCCWASHVVQLELNETMAAVPISSRFLGHIICTSHVSQRLFHDFIMRHSLFWLPGSPPPRKLSELILATNSLICPLSFPLSVFRVFFFRNEPTPCTSQKIHPPEVDPWLRRSIPFKDLAPYFKASVYDAGCCLDGIQI